MYKKAQSNKKSNVTMEKNTLPASNYDLPSNKDFTRKETKHSNNNLPQNKNATSKKETVKEKEPLSTKDKITNMVIGASLGLLAAGGVVCTAGIVATAFFGPAMIIPLFGTTAPQAAAIGALSFNFVSMIVAPFLGVSIEPIEFEQ